MSSTVFSSKLYSSAQYLVHLPSTAFFGEGVVFVFMFDDLLNLFW